MPRTGSHTETLQQMNAHHESQDILSLVGTTDTMASASFPSGMSEDSGRDAISQRGNQDQLP